jgi:hypothetical protein
LRHKKSNPIPRKRSPFGKALSAAKKELSAKIRERDRSLKQLQQLNVDIPNLERTCRALEAQLNGKGSTGPDARPTSQSVGKKVGEVLPYVPGFEPSPKLDDIPPEIRAQLPPEDLSQFGAKYDKEAETEEFLPPIVGKEVVPEKKP